MKRPVVCRDPTCEFHVSFPERQHLSFQVDVSQNQGHLICTQNHGILHMYGPQNRVPNFGNSHTHMSYLVLYCTILCCTILCCARLYRKRPPPTSRNSQGLSRDHAQAPRLRSKSLMPPGRETGSPCCASRGDVCGGSI